MKKVSIDPSAKIIGDCTFGEGCIIEGNSYIENSHFGDNVWVSNSRITDSKVRNGVKIGPFAHLRNGTEICDEVRIGNFVEIKNSYIGKGTKLAHLAYVGDATVGANVNVGCGVIFCNYDGKNKYKTIVEDNVFIGSNSNLVAPLKIGMGSFIAAGTTVTKDLDQNQFCISRSEMRVKENRKALQSELQKPAPKGKRYFGTDGIRGIFGKELTPDFAMRAGNALARLKENVKIVIGMDTRPSGKFLLNSFINGAEMAGASVVNAGVLTTPGISYLTQISNADFGVVISASHNPANYNGIKVFAADGRKISDETEIEMEDNVDTLDYQIQPIGNEQLIIDKNQYENYIISVAKPLKLLKLTLDTANGAASGLTERVFKALGATVVSTPNEGEINQNCGATCVENIVRCTVENGSDLGFSYDGDGDRLMVCSSDGTVLDGDKILLLLALSAKQKGEKIESAVGTLHTNMAIENELLSEGIKLIRANIGDRFVAEKMEESGSDFGGEQSGHIILKKLMPTGDGLCVSMQVAAVFQEEKELFKRVKELKLYPQINQNFVVQPENKQKILSNQALISLEQKWIKQLEGKGRILLRASGTEPKIRLMVECMDAALADRIATDFFEVFKLLST